MTTTDEVQEIVTEMIRDLFERGASEQLIRAALDDTDPADCPPAAASLLRMTVEAAIEATRPRACDLRRR